MFHISSETAGRIWLIFFWRGGVIDITLWVTCAIFHDHHYQTFWVRHLFHSNATIICLKSTRLRFIMSCALPDTQRLFDVVSNRSKEMNDNNLVQSKISVFLFFEIRISGFRQIVALGSLIKYKLRNFRLN